MGHGCKHHRKVLLHCLKEKMRQAGATNEKLAEAAGVSIYPINSAKQGNFIHHGIAMVLYQALNTYEFKRDPRGRR